MGSIGLSVIQGKCAENKNDVLSVSQIPGKTVGPHDSVSELVLKNRERQTNPSSEHAR